MPRRGAQATSELQLTTETAFPTPEVKGVGSNVYRKPDQPHGGSPRAVRTAGKYQAPTKTQLRPNFLSPGTELVDTFRNFTSRSVGNRCIACW